MVPYCYFLFGRYAEMGAVTNSETSEHHGELNAFCDSFIRSELFRLFCSWNFCLKCVHLVQFLRDNSSSEKLLKRFKIINFTSS